MNWLQKTFQIHEEDEGWVEDESGQTFWGSRGSGCLFVRNHPKLGFQVLLTRRGPGVAEPYTWGGTGGAVPQGEHDLFLSALRESEEEIGSLPQDYKVLDEWTWQAEGGTFTYTTFIIEVFDFNWLLGQWDQPENQEVMDVYWVPINKVSSYDLHFGITDLMNAIDLNKYAR